ncbi:MAG: S8 family serine peptidase [Gammaproteobacteria bacterium]|nr:S8 family serine peptidase [Gammaproteobacteria bacterium]
MSYVKSARPDKKLGVEPMGVTTLTPSQEVVTDNLYTIGVEEVWNAGYRGQGVVVAIIDSGVDLEHMALKSRWRGGTNSWFDPIAGSTEPVDFSGHGTAVASIVLGGNDVVGTIESVNYTGAYVGVAPNAQWIAAKVFDATTGTAGNSSTSTILEALQWVLDPDGNPVTDDYPDIVQNSWGLISTEGQCANTDFSDALDAINAFGIDIVFAAGNAGPLQSTHLTPSWYTGVISVGAVSTVNSTATTILNSSSRGPNACENDIFPSLVAPGVEIVAAEKSLGSVSARKGISVYTGTSFSAPHVSGALALLRSYFASPSDQNKFRNALFNSAEDMGYLGDDDNYGRGLVQVDAAVAYMSSDTAVTPVTKEVQFSSANYALSESTSSEEVALLRVGDITTAASVNVISEDATAIGGSDFVPVSKQITFLAGQSLKTITVDLLDDTEGEASEYFNLLIVGTNTRLRMNITDDDIVDEEDEIGGAASGILELLILSILWLGARVRR